jgi:hypothetical protein
MRVSLLAVLLLAVTAQAQVLKDRANVGPSSGGNPTSGTGTLDTLNAGFIDAGVLLLTSDLNQTGGNYSIGNGCISSVTGVTKLSCGPFLATNQNLSAGANSVLNWSAGFINYGDGTAAAPQLRSNTDTTTGLYRTGASQIGVTTAGARSFNFTATAGKLEGVTATPTLTLDNSSGSCLNYTGASLCVTSNSITASGTTGFNISAGTPFTIQSKPIISGSTPTISSGFGTSPSVTAGTSTAAFRVNVGTGGSATSGVIALNTTATTGWNCFCTDVTTASATVNQCKQTATSTTTATIGNFNTSGVAAAWVASDIIAVSCFGY